MKIRWHGQSAYTLTGAEHTVAIDPFGDLGALLGGQAPVRLPAGAGPRRRPAARDARARRPQRRRGDHGDRRRSCARPRAGSRRRSARWSRSRRSTTPRRARAAARTRSSSSRSTACACATSATSASPRLRPEQREAIGAVDLLILPVGGGPTIGAAAAAEITRALDPRWVVPMHYRTAGDRLPRAGRRVPGPVRGGRRRSGPSTRSSRTAPDRRASCTWRRRRSGAERGRPAMVQSMQSLYAYGRAFDVALIARPPPRPRSPRSCAACSCLVPGRCARLARPPGAAPLRARRHARARALPHSRRHHAARRRPGPPGSGRSPGSGR